MKLVGLILAVLSVLSACHAAGCPFAHTPVITDVLCPARLLPNTEYRPVDGALENTCNHTGKSFEPYGRIEKQHYNDCKAEIRKAKSGNDLPLARQVVNGVFRSFQRNLTGNYRTPNFMIAMMGQYIGHDIGSREDLFDLNVVSRCCSGALLTPIETRHPDCITMELPENDPDYARFTNIQCLVVLRSKVKEPTKYPNEPMNTVTAYIDHSNLYGSVDSVIESLKLGSGGEMLVDSDNVLAPGPSGGWLTGDGRYTQTPQLASLHSIHLREHNRIARILQGINPHWTDKRLFEETRRINIAQFQHIVYEEYLPTFIAPSVMRYMDAPDLTAALGAITFDEFNSAIFRLMHSLIPANLDFIAQDNTTTVWKFHKMILNSELLRHHYDEIVRGMLMQPVNTAGYDPALFQGLFAQSETTHGYDLLSLDLLRGRDHGLAPYVNVLALLKGSPITTFEGLAPYISDRHIALLRGVYEAVEDVDLLAGVLLEEPLEGYLMGPTSQLMFLKQFMRLKTADPYFYTNQVALVNPKPFTTAQLQEIKKANTNLLYCLNSAVEYVPKDPAYAPTSGADIVSCNSLQQISYESWRSTL